MKEYEQNHKEIFEVTPIWENNYGDKFSYSDDIFYCKSKDEVEEQIDTIKENYSEFKVRVITKTYLYIVNE